EQAHPDVIALILGKPVGLGPALGLEIGDDVLPRRLRRLPPEQPPGLPNPRQVMVLPAMPHSALRRPGKLIQPAMHLGEGFAESCRRLRTMFIKAWHSCPHDQA